MDVSYIRLKHLHAKAEVTFKEWDKTGKLVTVTMVVPLRDAVEVYQTYLAQTDICRIASKY